MNNENIIKYVCASSYRENDKTPAKIELKGKNIVYCNSFSELNIKGILKIPTFLKDGNEFLLFHKNENDYKIFVPLEDQFICYEAYNLQGKYIIKEAFEADDITSKNACFEEVILDNVYYRNDKDCIISLKNGEVDNKLTEYYTNELESKKSHTKRLNAKLVYYETIIIKNSLIFNKKFIFSYF